MRRVLLSLLVVAVHPLVLSAQGTADEYERSCTNGDLIDCSVLGLIYQTGAGGTRDTDRAIELYERACNREVAAACRRLEIVERAEASPTEPDPMVRVGFVADAYDGTPIGGAIIRIGGVSAVADRRFITDVTGRVVLDPLPRGRHEINVQRGGYMAMDGELPVPWDGDFLVLMERAVEEEEATTGGVFGQITDEGSGAGISEADVAIVVDGEPIMRTTTNGEGRFFLDDLVPGQVEVAIQRLGYEPRTTEVTIEAGRTVEVYASMSTRPIELEPVRVVVASRFLERTGFYTRALSAFGHRFTYRDIELMQPTYVSDVVRRVPGIRVETQQFGYGTEAISQRRQAGTGTASVGCRLRPYFNGVPLVDFNLELVPPDEIEALEVYQGADVPVEYSDGLLRDDESCGVVLIWSRDPSRRF